MLAGVSVEYFSRLERGNLAGASPAVLNAIASALLLNQDERAHLMDLSRAANESPVRATGHALPREAGQTMQLALDAITTSPAFVRNARMDVVAENLMFRALYSPLYAMPERPVNLAKFVFLHRESSGRFYPDWSLAADINVAILRTESGRNPHNTSLRALVTELSGSSAEFRTRWDAHNVRNHATGEKVFHHPIVGELRMLYQAMEPLDTPGMNFLIYTAEPGSRTADSLRLLASWAATTGVLT